MRMNIQNLVMAVVVSLFSVSGHAELVRDGGMSGGGGGSQQAEPVNEREVLSELALTRQNLYLYFNKLSMYPYPTDPRIDNIKDKILKVIEDTKIYAASGPCQDLYGQPKDGSIYSPYPNAICISVRNMVMKLRKDNLIPQINALVAHEFAHIAGLGEMDAVFIQDWVLKSFSHRNGDSLGMLGDAKNSLGLIESTVDKAFKSPSLSWNTFCYAGEAIDRHFRSLRAAEESGIYSFYDLAASKQRNSFVLKNLILIEAVCGFSDYHPDRERYRRNYQDDFGKNTQLTDTELEKILWQGDGSLTAGNVIVKKVSVLSDAQSELQDLFVFAKASLKRLKMIQELQEEPLQ